MDPISRINPTLDALRRQLSENIDKLRRSGKLPARGPAGPARGTASGAQALESLLAQRLAGLDRRTPEGLSAATRAFVEAALITEFGQELLADPGFGALLEDIAASLRADPEVRSRLDGLLGEF